MTPLATKTIGKYTYQITYDEMPCNPRDDDNLGTMVCFHGRSNYGDKHSFRDGSEVMEEIKNTEAIWLPIYIYEHSGVALSTSRTYPFNDRWDSGQLGVIYITKEKVIKEYGDFSEETLEKVRDVLVSEVEIYGKYVSGEVYEWSVSKAKTCKCCGNAETEVVESGSGYYELDDATSEAESTIKHLTEADEKTLNQLLEKITDKNSGALDVLVHSILSKIATDINNGDDKAQIAYIIETLGEKEAITAITLYLSSNQ